MINPYKVLGVSESATLEEIKSAKKLLLKKYHPDSGGDVNKFNTVMLAYDKIINMKNTGKKLKYGDDVKSDIIRHVTIFKLKRF